MEKKFEKWGFLRETTEDALKAGVEKNTGLHRTGLDEYLKAIFPSVDDWIHDKSIGLELNGRKIRTRPDYRSETLKMIVEFDGIPHYQKPDMILRDFQNTETYHKLGYEVVRIPYFIQLTNSAIETLFGIEMREPMFNPNHPSLDDSNGSPAYLCHAGLERMARDFKLFPDQYGINLLALKSFENDFLTGANLLEEAFAKIQ